MEKGDHHGGYYGDTLTLPHYPPNSEPCCCSCIAKLVCTRVFQILCTILLVVGIIIFVLWLIFRPDTLRFYANNAALSQFNLNNGNLQFNLTVNLSIQNPNRRISVNYDSIEAMTLYEGQRFSAIELPPFYQGQRTTNNLTADFSGQDILLLSDEGLRNYDNDRAYNMYGFNVQLFIRARLRSWIVRSMPIRARINCNLELPLISNNTAAGGAFQSQRCSFNWV